MASKLDRLRAGEVVEIEPGRKGRLNLATKMFETSDGRTIDVSEDEDFFPSSEKNLKLSQQRENIERGINKVPFGEFLHQLGSKGVLGGVADWGNKLTRSAEDYLINKEASQQVGEKISERSPGTSTAATVASFLPDFYLTRGMSAAKGVPLITGLSAGTRVLDEPQEVGKEAALGSLGGYFIDKGAKALNRIASRRGAIRQAKEGIVPQDTVKGLASEEEFVARQNEALKHQHNLELNARQNQMIDAENAFQKAKADREAEVFRLKSEFERAKSQHRADAGKLQQEYEVAKQKAHEEIKGLKNDFQKAQAEYQKDLQNLPRLQKETHLKHGEDIAKHVEKIQKGIPKDARIVNRDLGINNFLNQELENAGLAGSPTEAKTRRILNSIFPEGDYLTSSQLAQKYRAVEAQIANASPEVKNILNNFKEYMAYKLPYRFEDSFLHQKIIPMVEKRAIKDVDSILNKMSFGKGEEKTRQLLKQKASKNLESLIGKIESGNFKDALDQNRLPSLFKENVLSLEDFITGMGYNPSTLKKQGLYEIVTKELTKKHENFVNQFGNKIESALSSSYGKHGRKANDIYTRLGRDLEKTLESAPTVETPMAPQMGELPSLPSKPSLPSPPPPPTLPPYPSKSPMPPMPSAPVPLSAPPSSSTQMVPPPSTMTDKIAERLETPLFKGKANMNNLLKLGALKYALGSAAAPIEGTAAATYGLGKILTSPTAAGEAARLTFKQGGMRAIQSWAQKYPSYNNGVLENPQERRSLTKEIEDARDIPIEKKALYQSLINRGKPLEEGSF